MMESKSLFLSALLGLCGYGYCSDVSSETLDYTVTDEAWFEIEVKDYRGKYWSGKFTVGVFGDIVPLTSLNFISIARKYRNLDQEMWYKGSLVHRIVEDFMIQMGDITVGEYDLILYICIKTTSY